MLNIVFLCSATFAYIKETDVPKQLEVVFILVGNMSGISQYQDTLNMNKCQRHCQAEDKRSAREIAD